MAVVQSCVVVGVMEAGAAAPDDGFTPRRRPRIAMQQWLYGAESQLCIVSVATWCYVGSEVVGLVDATQRGRSDFTSGRRPRMWCGVRGLRAVVLCSMGCG